MKSKLRIVRIILIILAFATTAIPVLYVSVTGNALSETESHLVTSCTYAIILVATLLGIKDAKEKRPARIGIAIGLVILLILQLV